MDKPNHCFKFTINWLGLSIFDPNNPAFLSVDYMTVVTLSDLCKMKARTDVKIVNKI